MAKTYKDTLYTEVTCNMACMIEDAFDSIYDAIDEVIDDLRDGTIAERDDMVFRLCEIRDVIDKR